MIKHSITVPLGAHGFFAVCSCGWMCPDRRATKVEALDDGARHAKEAREKEGLPT